MIHVWHLTSCNRFKPVFCQSYIIFQNERPATGLQKTGPQIDCWSGLNRSSSVWFWSLFWFYRLDLQTLRVCNIEERLKVCKTKGQFPVYMICPHLLCPSNGCFHNRVRSVGIKIRVEVFKTMSHACKIFWSGCNELEWICDIVRQYSWCRVQGEGVKNTKVDIVMCTSSIVFWGGPFNGIHLQIECMGIKVYQLYWGGRDTWSSPFPLNMLQVLSPSCRQELLWKSKVFNVVSGKFAQVLIDQKMRKHISMHIVLAFNKP